MFRAVMIEKTENGQTASLQTLEDDALPVHEVLVDIDYSTLNYKDALALTNTLPIVKQYPLVPGIDFSGTVLKSDSPEFQAGQKVVLNGWGVGETYWGGLSEKASVDADWLVPLPDVFSTKDAMMIGTAGYTAMLCVLALEEQGVTPDTGDILVTGAVGGVGSVAVRLLSKLGYRVTALTGRGEERAYLEGLGASDVILRSEYQEEAFPPLAKERWAGAIDTVGGVVLSNICASMKYGGVVAATGLAGGMDFPATVMPFILRAVKLIGVDSVYCPKPKRLLAYDRLAALLTSEDLASIAQVIKLDEVLDVVPQFMSGQVKGRLVVDVRN